MTRSSDAPFATIGRPDAARLEPEAISRLQDRLLQAHLRYVAANSPFYRRLFAAADVTPEQVCCVADLARLPFTTKSDLNEANQDFLCANPTEVVDICLTSGTTARPVALHQTRDDLERLGFNEETAFRTAGVTAQDTVMIAAAIDRCFMAGLAYFLGLTRLGATVLRAGSSSLPVAADLILAHRPGVIVGVPTLLAALGERLLARGTRPETLGVRLLVCIGEPVRAQDFSLSALGSHLARLWDARVCGTYASTELATTFCECEYSRGGHFHPELCVVEILDEEGNSLPPGQVGEVVVTPLQVTGMPLVRFRTGDLAALHVDPCPCGRNGARLGPIQGRKNQALKYRGTTVYPPAVFAVLQGMHEIQGYYIEVSDAYELSDHICVVVGSRDPELTPKRVAETIASSLRVKPEVRILPPEEVAARVNQPDKRKPVTFFDYRQKNL